MIVFVSGGSARSFFDRLLADAWRVCSAGVSGNYTLPRWVAMGNDPGSRQLPAWPSMPAIVGMAEAVLGPYSGAAA